MTEARANPLSLFDVRGKVAIVTGASGAFGALAAEVLAAAGAKLVLTAGKAKELEEIAAKCREIGAEVEPQQTAQHPRLTANGSLKPPNSVLVASTFSSSRQARTTSPRSSIWRPNGFST